MFSKTLLGISNLSLITSIFLLSNNIHRFHNNIDPKEDKILISSISTILSFASWAHISRKYFNSPNIEQDENEQNQSNIDQRCEYFSPCAFSIVNLILTSFNFIRKIQENSNSNIDISCKILNAAFQATILFMTAREITSPNMPSASVSNARLQEQRRRDVSRQPNHSIIV